MLYKETLDKIELKLKAPLVALERVAEGKHLPQVFADVALSELKEAEKLVNDLKQARKKHD